MLMPSRDKHRARARHNEELVTTLGQLPNDPYPDWRAAALFYAAMHVAGAYLATRGRHSREHQERILLVRMECTLAPINANFRRLLNASRTARYDLVWEGLDVRASEDDLRAITTHLRR